MPAFADVPGQVGAVHGESHTGNLACSMSSLTPCSNIRMLTDFQGVSCNRSFRVGQVHDDLGRISACMLSGCTAVTACSVMVR